MIQAELVGHDDHTVIRHPLGNPVVAADGLQPPDFVGVRKGHAIGFIGAVLLQQRAGAQHAFPGRVDIGKHQRHQVFFANSSGNLFGMAALLGLIPDIGVRADDPGVAGDRLGGGHGHVGLIDAAGGPYAVGLGHVGAVGIAQGISRQLNRQVGDDGFVRRGILPSRVNQNTLGFKSAVVIAGNDCRAVMTGFLADQNRCTGHTGLLSLSRTRVFLFGVGYSLFPTAPQMD